MKLSDYIAGLQHLLKQHGDVPVLERRTVGWGGVTELFPDGIEIDQCVRQVASFHDTHDNKHHYRPASDVPADAKDRREYTAIVIGEIP